MKQLSLIAIILISGASSFAQKFNAGEIHGNLQLDAQYYSKDSLIGAPVIPEKLLSNGFLNLNYTNGGFYAGVRYESYLNPLSGFSPNYKGSGIPHRYAGYSADGFEVTAGNFYEQFGSGLIFRAYEEKNLGIDNSIDGLRLRYQPLKGVYLKGMIGQQRNYFSLGPGIVRGLDAEFSVNELLPLLAESKTRYTFGGSFVSKYQPDNDPIYRLPENVAAVAARASVQRNAITLSGEYAYKANDPSADNNLIYKPGEALLLNASYSVKGLGISLSGKRIDNMAFRSDRTANINDLTLSFLPPSCKQHTYILPALYPYATQPNGEIGFQSQLDYLFKKGSKTGGKYGTGISLNYSRIHGNDTTNLVNDTKNGYKTNYTKTGTFYFYKPGKLYFEDISAEISKKLSSNWKASYTLMHLSYNKDVVQGLAGYGIIKAWVHVADISYKINKSNTIRTELQHLSTKEDMQNWAAGLIEYTIAPHYFLAVYDQYNYGNSDEKKQLHYYNAQVGYIKNTLRIAMGYGRQREGIVCVGGVCRNVPASSGVTLAITNSF